jgi:hypothetical protein
VYACRSVAFSILNFHSKPHFIFQTRLPPTLKPSSTAAIAKKVSAAKSRDLISLFTAYSVPPSSVLRLDRQHGTLKLLSVTSCLLHQVETYLIHCAPWTWKLDRGNVANPSFLVTHTHSKPENVCTTAQDASAAASSERHPGLQPRGTEILLLLALRFA